MKQTILLGLLIFGGSSSAATWEKVGVVDGYYYSPAATGRFGERTMAIGEAMAGESAIVLATLFKSSKSLSCIIYEYAGELQETFVFSYWETFATPDVGSEINFKALETAIEENDKVGMTLFSSLICNALKTGPARNIYVPARFAELNLPNNFRDTTLKLTRLYGAATRIEIK